MQKSVFSKINYLLSLLSVAILGYLAWMVLVYCKNDIATIEAYEAWFVPIIGIYKGASIVSMLIVLAVIFCVLVSLQVLLTALSIGRKDRYTEIDYGKIVEFNKVVLVLYALYAVAVPVAAIVISFF